MAIMTMLIGQSGTGKSASLRNFGEEAAIINVTGKPYPYKTKQKTFITDDYVKISAAILQAVKNGLKIIVIDDATYLLVGEFMRTAKQPGYQKFTDMALHFYDLIKLCASLPDDVTVYFIGHIDADQNGTERFKTIGKLLDEKVTLEGLFTIVLKTVVSDGKYQFSTQNSGSDTVKSPMDMFDAPLIDNDLKVVDEAVRNFYGIPLEVEAKKSGKSKAQV